jgi:hypothetical protein
VRKRKNRENSERMSGGRERDSSLRKIDKQTHTYTLAHMKERDIMGERMRDESALTLRKINMHMRMHMHNNKQK